MSLGPESLVGTRLPDSVCARRALAGGLLEWLEAVLPPLAFAMCFSAAEERPGGILALPGAEAPLTRGATVAIDSTSDIDDLDRDDEDLGDDDTPPTPPDDIAPSEQ